MSLIRQSLFIVLCLITYTYVFPSKSTEPVCIIGAGPSGIAAALALKEKGIDSILFEKENRVGGKCKQFAKDGVNYDTGAILLADSYHNVRKLIRKYNLPTMNAGAETYNTSIFELGGFSVPAPAAGLLNDPMMAANITVFLRHLGAYLDLEHEVGYGGPSSKDPSLSLPFIVWLQQRDLLPLVQVFSFYFTGFGYGSMMETPALYVLKYSHSRNFFSFIGVTNMERLVNGYQNLMETIVQNESLNVKLGVNVTRVQPSSNQASVEYTTGVDTPVETQKCSKVIVAFPQLAANMQFMQLDAADKAVFEKVRSKYYYNFVFRLKNTATFDSMFPANSVYLNGMTIVNGVPTPMEPNVAGFPMIISRPNANTDVLAAYILSPTPANTTDLSNNLIETVNKLIGFKTLASEVEILNVESWETYFPHFEKVDIDSGIHERLESLQGKSNVFYTGGLLNFETVESAMDYSFNLVAKHF